MSEAALIVPRRNFLIRALGFTAAGAAVPVPIVTVASAEARLLHHADACRAAMRDLFPGVPIRIQGNIVDGDRACVDWHRDRWSRGERPVINLSIVGGLRE